MGTKTKSPNTGLDAEVHQPKYYMQWDGMEPFTFFMLNDVPFAEATVCKYILRWRKKNGVQDLEKAKRVIDMMIDLHRNRNKYQPERTAL